VVQRVLIAHKLEDPMGYYFEPSDKPPLKAVLVRHLAALDGRHSPVTCFLSSHNGAEGRAFVESVPKTDAFQSVIAKSDTEDKAKADKDHKSVPKESVAKKQSGDSNVEEEAFASLLFDLNTKAKSIVKSRKGPVTGRAILLAPAQVYRRGF
jgi:hypothetical protein